MRAGRRRETLRNPGTAMFKSGPPGVEIVMAPGIAAQSDGDGKRDFSSSRADGVNGGVFGR